jgi:hypothetical protein
MKLDAATDTIAITIESSGEPLSTVRVERAEGSSARISIRFENGAVVVTCGPDTILEGPPERKRRLLPPPDSLATIGDADWYPATPTVTRIGVPIEVEVLPLEEAPRPRPPVAPQALDPGVAPTRIEYHPPSESAVAASRPVAAPSVPPPLPATKGPRIRRSVRRFALLAMLAASWMLWFHAYRSRHAHATRAPAAGSASPASALSRSSGSAVGSPVAGRLAAQDSASAGTAASLPPRAPNLTEARAAADALANGDSASALKLYDDLASRSANNPAYAEVARSLRARAAPLPQ